MNFLKNKTFYLSLGAAALFAASGYYFATTNYESVQGETNTQVNATTSAPANAVVPVQLIDDTTTTDPAATKNVSFEGRPMMIYVRRVNDPIVCGDPVDASNTTENNISE